MDGLWPLVSFWKPDVSPAIFLTDLIVILHEVRGFTPNGVSGDSTLDEKMRIVNHRVEAWQVFWSDHYGK